MAAGLFDGPGGWVFAGSLVLAVLVLVKIWRAPIGTGERLALSVVVAIPLAGPLLAWWLLHDAAPVPPGLRDRQGFAMDVWARWRHVAEEKDPARRARLAREVRDRDPGQGG